MRSPRPGCELNIDVGIQYLEAWLRGNGCVPIYNLMEDAATAEISRAQVWQWAKYGARMNDGTPVSVATVASTIPKVLDNLKQRIGDKAFSSGRFDVAARMFQEMTASDEFPEFLTIPAYQHLA